MVRRSARLKKAPVKSFAESDDDEVHETLVGSKRPSSSTKTSKSTKKAKVEAEDRKDDGDFVPLQQDAAEAQEEGHVECDDDDFEMEETEEKEVKKKKKKKEAQKSVKGVSGKQANDFDKFLKSTVLNVENFQKAQMKKKLVNPVKGVKVDEVKKETTIKEEKEEGDDGFVPLEIDDADDSRITQSRAVSEYCVSKANLEGLDCQYATNPHYRSAAPMRLYLVREVKALHNENKMREIQHKKDREAIAKKAREDKLNAVPPDRIAESLQRSVFGDFLDNKEKPKTGIMQVKKHYKACVRMQQTLAPEYWKRSMLIYFLSLNKVSDSKLEKTFASGALIADIRNVLARSETFLKPFGEMNVLTIIGDLLDVNSIENLEAAFKEESFVGMLRNLRSGDHIKNDIKDRVTELMGDNGVWKAKGIDKFSKKVLTYAVSYPDHPDIGRAHAADRIVHHLRSTPESRTEELREGLAKHGIQLRSDSKLCKGYIDSTIDTPLEHVIAIMRITNELFSYPDGHLFFSHNHEAWKRKLWQYVTQKNMTFEEATAKVLTLTPREPRVVVPAYDRWY